VNNTISRPKKILAAFIGATILGESCTKRNGQTTHSQKSLRWKELQMDWLRSEDLKEEKNVTAPVVIIAVCGDCRARSVTIDCDFQRRFRITMAIRQCLYVYAGRNWRKRVGVETASERQTKDITE